ncbi:glucosaminidase domain-containing protein [Streptococcus hyointestinalis]|uniref:Mannosyl-glycoendo-beta-N-acetylglucosaminidase family protein n=1 Tax=Streptococcus hyointestinalis TaxID=1337 RepID=A0A380K6B0_9STRE|nr:glycoside hydrolase family 73 protein [Streptococcus hyointestinalis]SUN59761.1 mannosyl-glycoendo-beta-N-acetylglucosaminidase family protein [Streptococcus hyointestinalis]
MRKSFVVRLVSAVAILGVGAALVKSYSSSGTQAKAETGTTVSSTRSFIDAIAPTARQIGQEYDLYASVLIAQAVLESSNGQSALSQSPYYNLFGIKGSYNGSQVTMTTWEDDGSGNAYQVNAAFRAYPSYAASLYDYASVLNSDYYAGVHKSNTSSYLDATASLTGTYATDTNYATKLNQIIATYGLTAYDTVDLGTGSYASGQVWNSYRGSYTDQATLDEDTAWANR